MEIGLGDLHVGGLEHCHGRTNISEDGTLGSLGIAPKELRRDLGT